MKRFITLLLVSLMICGNSIAFAENIDFSTMTETELQSVIDQARLELTKYHPAATKGSILYEDECIRILLNEGLGFNHVFTDELEVSVIIENHSSHNLSIWFENASCNGWSIDDGHASVPANKKAKEVITFDGAKEDAELDKVEDVQDIEAYIRYYDSNTYNTIIDGAQTKWVFDW